MNRKKLRPIIIVPLVLIIGVLLYLAFQPNKASTRRVILPPEQSYLSTYFRFSGQRQYLKIKDSAAITPQKDQDFILTFWLRLNRKNTKLRAYRLLQKFEEVNGHKQGLSLLLELERGGLIRPMIVWNSQSAAKEKAFRYLELKLPLKTWTLLTVAVKNGRYVLMRAVSIKDNKPLAVENLGAYDLENFYDISNAQDYVMGSLGVGGFHGDLGPIFIMSGQNLVEDLDSIIGQIVTSPEKTPVLPTSARLAVAVFPDNKTSSDLVIEYNKNTPAQ